MWTLFVFGVGCWVGVGLASGYVNDTLLQSSSGVSRMDWKDYLLYAFWGPATLVGTRKALKVLIHVAIAARGLGLVFDDGDEG